MICTYCQEPATMYCDAHRQYLCADPLCRGLHRTGGGDCEFISPDDPAAIDWMAIVVHCGIVMVIATALCMAWAHVRSY